MVEAALEDPGQAPLRPVVRAALALAKALAHDPDSLSAAHVQAVRDAGADDASIEQVITICAAFATINRIADSLEFALLTREQYDSSAKLIYKRGYALP